MAEPEVATKVRGPECRGCTDLAHYYTGGDVGNEHQTATENELSAEAKRKVEIAKFATHLYREILYDLIQTAVMAWVMTEVSLTTKHFPFKLLVDFLNVATTVGDLVIIKGPSAFSITSCDPLAMQRALLGILEEQELTSQLAEQEAEEALLKHEQEMQPLIEGKEMGKAKSTGQVKVEHIAPTMNLPGVFLWDAFDLVVFVLWAWTYQPYVSEGDQLSFIIIAALVIAPGVVLLLQGVFENFLMKQQGANKKGLDPKLKACLIRLKQFVLRHAYVWVFAACLCFGVFFSKTKSTEQAADMIVDELRNHPTNKVLVYCVMSSYCVCACCFFSCNLKNPGSERVGEEEDKYQELDATAQGP